MNIDKIEISNLSLEEIRKIGFPYYSYPKEYLLNEFNNLKQSDSSKLLENNFIRTSKSYTKLASQFFPHMFETRVYKMYLPMEAWNDDRLLQKAINLAKRFSKNPTMATLRSKLMIVNHVQCVSNFRPDVAKLIYDKYGCGGKVFDFSMGYGGRLVGFLASKCCEYIGVDVNQNNFSGYSDIINLYNIDKKVEAIRYPSENYCEYKDYFDLAFSSPPYFKKEIYSSDVDQSCNKYEEYETWRENYLHRTIDNLLKMTKTNGYIVINIANVTVGSKRYFLVDDCFNYLSKVGLRHVETLQYSLKKTIGTRSSFKSHDNDFKKEPILVFQKA